MPANSLNVVNLPVLLDDTPGTAAPGRCAPDAQHRKCRKLADLITHLLRADNAQRKRQPRIKAELCAGLARLLRGQPVHPPESRRKSVRRIVAVFYGHIDHAQRSMLQIIGRAAQPPPADVFCQLHARNRAKPALKHRIRAGHDARNLLRINASGKVLFDVIHRPVHPFHPFHGKTTPFCPKYSAFSLSASAFLRTAFLGSKALS